MKTKAKDQGSEDKLSAARESPKKNGKLPCGSRVCVRCHKGCGVVMAAYLAGLDEGSALSEERV